MSTDLPDDVDAFVRACESRAEKATPGPWVGLDGHESKTADGWSRPCIKAAYRGELRILAEFSQHFPSCDDAAFIVSARADIPRLTAIVRAQGTKIAALEKWHGDIDAEYRRMLLELQAAHAATIAERDRLAERLARAEVAELALLDLRRVMGSNYEPSNVVGAQLLVADVERMRDRLAKLEALPESLDKLADESEESAASCDAKGAHKTAVKHYGMARGLRLAGRVFREMMKGPDDGQA